MTNKEFEMFFSFDKDFTDYNINYIGYDGKFTYSKRRG